MAKDRAKAFTYDLSKNKGGATSKFTDEDVIQQNPGWVVVFVRFSFRDTRNNTSKNSSKSALKTREPFVVVNDCVNIKISQTKTSPFGSCEATFRSGDINYLSAIAPGDYMLAWIHDDIDRLDSVIKTIKGINAENADKSLAANDFDSGFKFVGKVEGVREELTSSPAGIKTLVYNISAHSFQEFNTKVYSSKLLDKLAPKIKFANLRREWLKVLNKSLNSGRDNVQDLVKAFINIFMGIGPNPIKLGNTTISPNEAFLVPKLVGRLLGRTKKEKGALKYTDILTLVLGIQKYSNPKDNIIKGFIPLRNASSDTQYSTGNANKCTGMNISQSDSWSDVPVWAILRQYANLVINELYACMRVDEDGRIVPTVTMRQIPFSTEEFKKVNEFENVTLFMNLPRWKLHPAQVLNHNIGRSNALRVNYVQVWGSTQEGEGGEVSTADYQQINDKNIQVDVNDIKRSGVRTLVVTSIHDQPIKGKITRSPSWSRIVADWAINGHLKTNGTITTTGIMEPICIGDNLVWNNTVFHIEQVVHLANQAPTGPKTFRTIINVSNGLDIRTGAKTEFPNMKEQFRENLEEGDEDGIYPGYTDVQDIGKRVDGELQNVRNDKDLSGKDEKE